MPWRQNNKPSKSEERQGIGKIRIGLLESPCERTDKMDYRKEMREWDKLLSEFYLYSSNVCFLGWKGTTEKCKTDEPRGKAACLYTQFNKIFAYRWYYVSVLFPNFIVASPKACFKREEIYYMVVKEKSGKVVEGIWH